MHYRAAHNRCAVILDDLRLPISKEEALAILLRKNFSVVTIDIIELARTCLGTSLYRRGARVAEAPEIVDCSSLTKWLYGMRGIWLPRRSIQQRAYGMTVHPDQLIAGDLVFTSGWIDYYDDDPSDGVGHVGIVTKNKMVIHAANKHVNVVETPIEQFIDEKRFRGARRYLPNGIETITFETPLNREVEISDDIRWIILQSLP